MKKMIAMVLAFSFALAFAGTYSKAIKGNIGQSIPLFGSAPNGEPVMGGTVVLDTMEIDTSKYFYDLIDKPLHNYVDTVGTVHFACKDSTGTDTLAIKLKWQGNPQSNGGGVWANIDSVTLKDLGASGAAAQGVLTGATPTTVVNSKSYMSLRFVFTNILGANANRKSSCTTPIFNRRPHLTNFSTQQ